MKNFSKYFLMGTVALSGMTAFTACSSENEPSAEVNPTFNGSTVKAQFALNLPYAATGTRMTENATQQNSNFRGMSSMTLLPFAETTVDGVQTSTSAMLLGTNANAFDKDGDGQGRYVYRDIEIPVGTQSFVFYGKATGTPASVNADNADDCFKYGYLTEKPISAKDKVSLSDVKFALEETNSNLNLETAVGTGDKSYNKVLAALDKVTGTKVGTIAWNNIGTTANDMKLEHAKKLWSAFSDLKAGSSASVKVALERLAESTGVEALAGATATKDGAGLLALLHKNADEAAASLATVNFPNDINIPDGAVALKYTASDGWKYQSSVTMKENNKIAYANITYPASLNYFVKTAAMANANAATTLGSTASFWPDKDEWAKYDAENSATDPWTSVSGWSQGVKNSTRTIALKEAIQYGVANLKLTINAKTDHLDDNAHVTGGQVADQNIDVTGNKLKMTGVLVGGQPSEVAWNYEPTTGATFDRTVYDNKMNKSADDVNDAGIDVPVNSPSTSNYTLVLDNKNNATGGSQADVVYVTVELVNGTDVDFYGVDGMVPKGGKFYLVGKLDMNTVSDTKKNGCDHIFVQDHTTVANLTIKDLRNAYNNIPDLRSTSVSVGLAVNLTWENGIEFNVEI